jgi:hypothetical protein
LEGKAADKISAHPVVSKAWWNLLVKQLRVGGPSAAMSVGAKAFGFEALG